MPQTRVLLQQTASLKVERVVLHDASLQWSPNYKVTSQRLVLPASGATEFRVAGQTVLLDGLTALCLPTGQSYQMKPCTAGALRASIVVSVQMGGALALPQLEAWQLTPRAAFGLRRHWRALAVRCEDHLGHGESGDPTQALLRNLLQPAARAMRAQGRSGGPVQRAKSFMAARTVAGDGTPWTLHDVADVAACSLFHLAREFRRHTGMSLHQYRQHLRVANALQLLEGGERQLAAVAQECGFSSQSHMGTVFQRELGVTPSAARLALAD
jgi:AraC-like DNA-binding protein